MNKMKKSIISTTEENDLASKLSLKIRNQAKELQSQAEEIESLKKYISYCEQKIREIQPSTNLPITEVKISNFLGSSSITYICCVERFTRIAEIRSKIRNIHSKFASST